MSKFIRNIRIEKEFEGDTVVVILKPIGFDAFLGLKSGAAGMLEAIRAHVVVVSGLHDAAGAAITLEEMLSTAYFTLLVADIFSEWMEKCVPGKVWESARSQGGSPPDSTN